MANKEKRKYSEKVHMYFDKNTKDIAEKRSNELGLNLSSYVRYLINKAEKDIEKEEK